MIAVGVVRHLLVRGVRVYVNPASGLAGLTRRVVLQPDPRQLERLGSRYSFMLENMAFQLGRAVEPGALVAVAKEWCANSKCELVVAPDKLGDQAETMRLHKLFVDQAPQWLLEKSLAVIHERRPSRIMSAVDELMDLGFERAAVPSDNAAAMRLLQRIADRVGYVHVLGCQRGCLHHVLRAPIDSIDVYVEGAAGHGGGQHGG